MRSNCGNAERKAASNAGGSTEGHDGGGRFGGQLQALARRTHLLRLDAGEILFQQGDRARMVYLLLRVLKQLNAKGIISLAGGNIVRVPERHRLQRFVEQSGKS